MTAMPISPPHPNAPSVVPVPVAWTHDDHWRRRGDHEWRRHGSRCDIDRRRRLRDTTQKRHHATEPDNSRQDITFHFRSPGDTFANRRIAHFPMLTNNWFRFDVGAGRSPIVGRAGSWTCRFFDVVAFHARPFMPGAPIVGSRRTTGSRGNWPEALSTRILRPVDPVFPRRADKSHAPSPKSPAMEAS